MGEPLQLVLIPSFLTEDRRKNETFETFVPWRISRK